MCTVVGLGTMLLDASGRADDAPPLPAATNLDFESDATPSGAPAGWTVKEAAYALTVDTEGVHGGKRCGRVASGPGAPPFGGAFVTQTISAAPYRGKRVRVSGFLRMKDVTSYAGMRMRVNGPGKEPLAADRRQDHSTGGTTGWTQQSVVLDVAEAAETIEYGIVLSGSGSAWLDDFVVEAVGSDVPSTDVRSYVATPTNMDFEGATHPRGMPLHWLGGTPGYDFVYDGEAPHGGKRSAKLAWTGDPALAAAKWTAFGQTMPAASWRGKRVRFAAWIRTKDAAGRGCCLWLRADDAAEHTVALDNMNGFEVTGSTAWTLCEAVMDVPQSAERLVYGVILSGSGAAWCDDFELAAVGPETPCTTDPLAMAPPLAESADKANFDFESAADPDGRPGGWHGGNRGYVPSADTKSVHGGKASGRLAATAAQAAHPGAGGGLIRAVKADAYRGKRLRVTAWIRTEKASAEPEKGAGFGVSIQGETLGDMLAADSTEERLLHGDTDWTSCAIVLDVPEAAKSVFVSLGLAGPGTAWFDDVTLEVVGTDVPCTGKK